jgi:hypothetical protein
MPDEACLYCGEAVSAPELAAMKESFPALGTIHRDCSLRMVVGGVNHQIGRCSCCGGTEDPDPPGLTIREAARVAALHYRASHDC